MYGLGSLLRPAPGEAIVDGNTGSLRKRPHKRPLVAACLGIACTCTMHVPENRSCVRYAPAKCPAAVAATAGQPCTPMYPCSTLPAAAHTGGATLLMPGVVLPTTHPPPFHLPCLLHPCCHHMGPPPPHTRPQQQ